MGRFPFGWPMDPTASDLTGVMPLPSPAACAPTNGATYCGDPAVYAFVLPDLPAAFPSAAAVEAERRRQDEVDAGVRLVHLLMSCAGAVQAGDHVAASAHLSEAHAALAAISTASGIGRVATHFAAALSQRLFPSSSPDGPSTDHAVLYQHFYEACPYLKFAHFTANQAILEAFDGCDRVHVIDFNLMQGLQWPALIQALALRPGGPPFIRITGIGPRSTTGRDELREVGLRLAEIARSVRVGFAFRGIAANRLHELRPWMLQLAPGEAVAINSVLQLHRLLADPDPSPTTPAPIDTLLDWIVAIQPKIFTIVEQQADHNKPEFLGRFTEALFYYSAVFDSLEAAGRRTGGVGGSGSALAELYLQKEICDIVCGEGIGRAERHELLALWRDRLGRAGLSLVPLGSNALRQARLLLGMFSAEGYGVEESDGCLTMGWHGRMLYSSSAWRAAAAAASGEGGNNSNSNNNGSSDSNNSSGSTCEGIVPIGSMFL